MFSRRSIGMGVSTIRLFSSTPIRPAAKLSVSQRSEGIYHLEMSNAPVNSFSLEFLRELNGQLEKLDNSADCRGLIISSALPKIFSGGLDIREMCRPEPARLAAFWREFQDFFLRLYGSRLATIAVVNGAAPAGGCLLALSCDTILASETTQIGLNETQLGIVAPFWFRDLFESAVGHRVASRSLQLGQMFGAAEAVRIGLVDKIVPTERLMEESQAELSRWLKISDAARLITKTEMRRPLVEKLLRRREDDLQEFLTFCQKESVQKAIERYLESLKKRR